MVEGAKYTKELPRCIGLNGLIAAAALTRGGNQALEPHVGDDIAVVFPVVRGIERHRAGPGELHPEQVDRRGIVWTTGNGNGTIGRLDPARLRELQDFSIRPALQSVAEDASDDGLAVGHKVEKDDGLYLASSRQAFIWPYDEAALLKQYCVTCHSNRAKAGGLSLALFAVLWAVLPITSRRRFA